MRTPRAFASKPKLVICDEITSALDVSVQASVVELLVDLQKRFGTAYRFITHDLNLVRQIAHRVAVMYRGDLVDLVDVTALTDGTLHPYTRSLLDAVPALLGRFPDLAVVVVGRGHLQEQLQAQADALAARRALQRDQVEVARRGAAILA